jgi:hypothetical protein
MLHAPLEYVSVMAGETVNGRVSEALRRDNGEQRRKQNKSGTQETGPNHYFALPS